MTMQSVKILFKKNKFILFIISLFSVIFLYLNITYWHSLIIGVIFFATYFAINGFWLGDFLGRILKLGKVLKFIFGLFLLIFLISFGGAIFVAFYKITPTFLLIILTAIALLSFYLSFKTAIGHCPSDNFLKPASQPSDDSKPKLKVYFYFIFIVCLIISFYLLISARTDKFILSPWEIIPPIYLYFYLLTVFLFGVLILFRRQAKTVLLWIILLTLFSHAVLPMVYQTGFGGDKWRHIGAERYLQQGQIYQPALFGDSEISYKEIGPFKIPAVLVVGNKTSYSGFWAANLIFSWLLNIDVFWIDFFLVLILWVVFLPVFLFILGNYLFEQKKEFSVCLAFLPAVFYIFLYYGSLSVPVSFGFLFFVFILIFGLDYFKNKRKLSLILAVILTLMMYLNYLVYFVALMEIGLLVWVFLKKEKWAKRKWLIILAAVLVGLICLFPILDIFSGLTILNQGANLKTSLADFTGRMFGMGSWMSFSEEMTRTNFIYNQTVDRLSFNTLFSFLFWPVAVSLAIWALVIYGAIKLRKNKIGMILSLTLIFLLIDHFIGWYLMSGTRIFIKRLDLIIGLLMLIFVASAVYNLIFEKWPCLNLKYKIIAASLVISLMAGSVLASGPGPMVQMVTGDEVKAAQYVYQQIKEQPLAEEKHCVLANTWPLLALEAVSNREITVGGFPVYQEYTQPERVQLFKGMLNQPSVRYMEQALEVTGADGCYFMTEEKWWRIEERDKILPVLREIFGEEEKKIGEVYVFYYSP